MKRLIVAAALVCVAFVSQGAQLQWGMTSIAQTKDSSLVNGAVGYFMAAGTLEAFSAAADKAAYCAANYTYTGSATVGRANAMSVTSGSYNQGDAITGYVVLFDTKTPTTAGYYCNTGILSTSAPGIGNATLQPVFAVATAMEGGNGWTAIGGPEPVPEPTSGLLLMLGVAGLALRRKQK